MNWGKYKNFQCKIFSARTTWVHIYTHLCTLTLPIKRIYLASLKSLLAIYLVHLSHLFELASTLLNNDVHTKYTRFELIAIFVRIYDIETSTQFMWDSEQHRFGQRRSLHFYTDNVLSFVYQLFIRSIENGSIHGKKWITLGYKIKWKFLGIFIIKCFLDLSG